MKIFLVDKQKWILITIAEAKQIVNSNLKPEEFTSESIQRYLLF